MAWFRREKQPIQPAEGSRVRTEGLWVKCDGCRQIIWKKDLETTWNVCPQCGFHFRLDARARLRLLLDDGKYTEQDAGLETTDPLHFVDLKSYQDRLHSSQQATGLKDALISAELSGHAFRRANLALANRALQRLRGVFCPSDLRVIGLAPQWLKPLCSECVRHG